MSDIDYESGKLLDRASMDRLNVIAASVIGGFAIGAEIATKLFERLDSRFTAVGDNIQNIRDRGFAPRYPVYTCPDVTGLILEEEIDNEAMVNGPNSDYESTGPLTDTQIANIFVEGDIHLGVPVELLQKKGGVN